MFHKSKMALFFQYIMYKLIKDYLLLHIEKYLYSFIPDTLYSINYICSNEIVSMRPQFRSIVCRWVGSMDDSETTT